METKRKVMGRGLEQLFSNEVINFDAFERDIVNNTKVNDIVEIPLQEIRSNPYQPRKSFNEASLQELAESIKEYGVVQPIIVKKSIKGYELIAGERRKKASEMAGLEVIPAIIKDFDDQEMMEIALIENIQREDLNPIDEALAYQNIIELSHLTQDEFAKRFGKSRSHVTNMLGLLKLPNATKQLVESGTISMGHARALSKISDEVLVNQLSDRVLNESLSVRDLEHLIAVENLPKKNKVLRKESEQNIHYLITYIKALIRLDSEKIGTKVKIKEHKIEIPFDREKDLERILEILGIEISGD